MWRARRNRARLSERGPRAALDKALEIAAELGLETYNAEGYIGWAQTGPIAGGQKYLATITHTDVVPEGNGWDADPTPSASGTAGSWAAACRTTKAPASSACMR